MEKEVIYGVFAKPFSIPTITNKEQELMALAQEMDSFGGNEAQKVGRFVRAYKNLCDAVEECMINNGNLIKRRLEAPQGVKSGMVADIYYPMEIVVEK